MSMFTTDGVSSDTRVREEVADGVMLERRSVLRLSVASMAAAFAATSCASPQRADVPLAVAPVDTVEPVSDGLLEIGELLDEMYPQARQLIASGVQHEEAYIMGVCGLLSRLRIPTKERLRDARDNLLFKHGPPASGRFEIAIVQFDFEPGKGFSHHDHRDYNGVIMGVEGSAHVTSYDIVGPDLIPPEGTTFQIRQTRDDVILPGRFSTLGSTRENVHALAAGPEGGKVLDVFTYFEPDARSFFMDVDPVARDAERRIYDAAWS